MGEVDAHSLAYVHLRSGPRVIAKNEFLQLEELEDVL